MVEATHCDPRTYPLLSQIGTPADLRALPPKQLGEVCRELREYLINTVATRGGHFAAGLGTVENSTLLLLYAIHIDLLRGRSTWEEVN